MPRLAQSLADGIYSRAPPFLWVLLSTPDARRKNRILRKSETLNSSLHREYDHLHARGAKIYSKQATHETFSANCSGETTATSESSLPDDSGPVRPRR